MANIVIPDEFDDNAACWWFDGDAALLLCHSFSSSNNASNKTGALAFSYDAIQTKTKLCCLFCNQAITGWDKRNCSPAKCKKEGMTSKNQVDLLGWFRNDW